MPPNFRLLDSCVTYKENTKPWLDPYTNWWPERKDFQELKPMTAEGDSFPKMAKPVCLFLSAASYFIICIPPPHTHSWKHTALLHISLSSSALLVSSILLPIKRANSVGEILSSAVIHNKPSGSLLLHRKTANRDSFLVFFLVPPLTTLSQPNIFIVLLKTYKKYGVLLITGFSRAACDEA